MTTYQVICDYCGYKSDWESYFDSEPVCYKCKDNNNIRVKKKALAGTNPFGYDIPSSGNHADDEQE